MCVCVCVQQNPLRFFGIAEALLLVPAMLCCTVVCSERINRKRFQLGNRGSSFTGMIGRKEDVIWHSNVVLVFSTHHSCDLQFLNQFRWSIRRSDEATRYRWHQLLLLAAHFVEEALHCMPISWGLLIIKQFRSRCLTPITWRSSYLPYLSLSMFCVVASDFWKHCTAKECCCPLHAHCLVPWRSSLSGCENRDAVWFETITD